MTASLAAPAPPAAPPPLPGSTPATQRRVTHGKLPAAPKRIGIYGPGGVGKTTLVAALAGVGIKPLMVDLEDGSRSVDVDRVGEITTYEELGEVLRDAELLKPYGAVGLDSLSRVEELATAYVLRTIPTNASGAIAKRLDDYGYGRGPQLVYDAVMRVFAALDNIRRGGKHVVVVSHSIADRAPNPNGEDWLRYEPRLQNPNSGKGSTRAKFFEWADNVFFIGYDVAVNRESKATAGGSRMIYTSETPWALAKSRDLGSQQIPYTANDLSAVWRALFPKQSK